MVFFGRTFEVIVEDLSGFVFKDSLTGATTVCEELTWWIFFIFEVLHTVSITAMVGDTTATGLMIRGTTSAVKAGVVSSSLVRFRVLEGKLASLFSEPTFPSSI